MNNNKAICPICGKPNRCALENREDITKCWCSKKKMSRNVKTMEYTSCICEECFDKLNDAVEVNKNR